MKTNINMIVPASVSIFDSFTISAKFVIHLIKGHAQFSSDLVVATH